MRRLKINITAVCACAFLALAACTSNPHPEGKPIPAMTFAHYEPVNLPLRNVDVVNKVGEGSDPAAHFVEAPDQVLHEYLVQRYQPAGSRGNLRIIIDSATIARKVIEPKNRFFKWMHLKRQEEYTLSLKLAFVAPERTEVPGQAQTLNLERSFVMLEDASLAEREKQQAAFLEKTIAELDGYIRQLLRERLGML